MKEYIVFDLDGTLIDTSDLVVDSWKHVIKYYTGKEADRTAILHTFGEPIEKTMKLLFPNENQKEALEIYRKYQAKKAEEKIKVFDGIKDMLQALKDRGKTLGIVTSRTRITAEVYVKMTGINKFFDTLITCDDVVKHKPSPEPLLLALSNLGAEKRDSIMIGDTRFDIGCANSAGVESVLLQWSRPADEKELAELGYIPTYRIKKPEELLELV